MKKWGEGRDPDGALSGTLGQWDFLQDQGGTSSESGPETRQGVWILGWKWIGGGLGALQPDRSLVLSKGPILPGRERSLSPPAPAHRHGHGHTPRSSRRSLPWASTLAEG